MEKIIQYLKDPSWWFATVLVGTIASLFAAYIKDYLSIILSKISDRHKIWRKRNDDHQCQIVAEWSSDSTLIIIAFIMLAIKILLFITMTACFIGISILIQIKPQVGLLKFIINGLSLVIGVFSVFNGYKTMRATKLVALSYSKYKQNDRTNS